jgi:hypothetical protein
MLKNISISLFLLLSGFISGCRQNYNPNNIEPSYGMSIEELQELCGRTDHVIFMDSKDKGETILIYREEEITTAPSCYGKFTFSHGDKLSSKSKK